MYVVMVALVAVAISVAASVAIPVVIPAAVVMRDQDVNIQHVRSSPSGGIDFIGDSTAYTCKQCNYHTWRDAHIHVHACGIQCYS